MEQVGGQVNSCNQKLAIESCNDETYQPNLNLANLIAKKGSSFLIYLCPSGIRTMT